MVQQRTRDEGWKHAKLSGHKNEDLVKIAIEEDSDFATKLLLSLNASDKTIKKVSIGGLHEKNVENIIPGGRKTKSKTDLKIEYTDDTYNNISIKKSTSGQVYYVRSGIFFDCFETHFKVEIPSDVKKAITLFWSSPTNPESKKIIEIYADKGKKKEYELQVKHNSVNAETLKKYNESLYNSMLQWFKDNAYELAFLSFASGAAKNDSDWSDHVWYINLLKENNVNEVFSIKDICDASKKYAESRTYYGSDNGGTTIQLPFGFIEWHHNQLQFHHKYSCVKALFSQ